MIHRSPVWQISVLLVFMLLANVPGFVQIHRFYEDCRGLTCLGLAMAYVIYVGWLACYALYYLLLLRFFNRKIPRLMVVYLPAAVSVTVIGIMFGEISDTESFITLGLMTLPNVVFPVVFARAFRHPSIGT